MRAKKYTGQTNNLRRRLREHNAPDNTSYTKGRKWRLLATRCFPDRSSALRYERQLKHSRYDKRNWLRKLARLKVLEKRFGMTPRRRSR
ncbi:MAG: GIY-YIG nuclease family protein [Planctomycetota bacterium]